MSDARDRAFVIGGGPAGLSAALVLARGYLDVTVIDAGAPRNEAAAAVHGFLGHDGSSPAALRTTAHAELARYGVALEQTRAVGIDHRGGWITVTLEDGRAITAPMALLTMGVIDRLPALSGLREAWGASAFSCPYCHGHEQRGRRWGALALQKSMLRTAPIFLRWTPSVTLLANGRTDLDEAALAALMRRGVTIEPRPLRGLRTEDGAIRAALFDDGERPLDALVVHPPQRQTDLVLFAGVALDEEGYVKIDDAHRTSMPGLYAAGDCTGATARAIAAAAHGADAAVSMIESSAR